MYSDMRPLQYHIPTEVKPHISNIACSTGTYALTSTTLLAQQCIKIVLLYVYLYLFPL